MERKKIKLRKKERDFLMEFIRNGTKKARAIASANILLLANEGKDNDIICQMLKVHRQKIWRVKKRYIEEGLEATLSEKPRSGQPRKYKNHHEAEIIALACTNPPEGRKRWALQLLAETLQKKKDFETITGESIRLVLKKAKLNLG